MKKNEHYLFLRGMIKVKSLATYSVLTLATLMCIFKATPMWAGEIIPDANTVGLWHVNETAMDQAPGGADAEDFSGNANHGTAEASMTDADWVTGKFGNALDFDGVDDYVDINAAILPTSNGLQPLTIEAWIKTTTATGGGIGNWSYSKPIAITGSSADQTNYQVLVTVDTASLISIGKMQSDGADIRFANSSNTELPYWIESGINSSSTKIWVEVDLIPAVGTTIYMYYSNPFAMSSSDANAVFEFFDDFPGTTIDTSKWVEWDNGNYLSQNNQLIATGGSNNWQSNGLRSVQNFNRADGWVLEFDYYHSSDGYLIFGWKDTDGSCSAGSQYSCQLVYGYYAPTYERVYVTEDGNDRGQQSGNFNLNTWYKIRMPLKTAGGAQYEKSSDGGNTWETSYDSSYSTEATLKIGIVIHSCFIFKPIDI